MDTYWSVKWDKCVRCGRCVTACNELSKWKHLVGGRDVFPTTYDDVLGCVSCEQFCKDVCVYDAICIERW